MRDREALEPAAAEDSFPKRVLDYFLTQAAKGAGSTLGNVRRAGDLAAERLSEAERSRSAVETTDSKATPWKQLQREAGLPANAAATALRAFPTEQEATAAINAIWDNAEARLGTRFHERNWNPIVDAIVQAPFAGLPATTVRALADKALKAAAREALKEAVEWSVSPDRMQMRLAHPPMTVPIGQR